MRFKKFIVIARLKDGSTAISSPKKCEKAQEICERAKSVEGVTDIEVYERSGDKYMLVVKESRRQIGF